jgi:hypothetical protein
LSTSSFLPILLTRRFCNIFCQQIQFIDYLMSSLTSSERAVLFDGQTQELSNLLVTPQYSGSDATSTKRRGTTCFRTSTFTWSTAVKIALATCTLSFAANLVLSIVASHSFDGYQNGIGTLHHGTYEHISRLSTIYHIMINALSTLLLVSSNYCMQLLCAPTKQDIARAHARGEWLDIGIMSLRNLRYIGRQRATLWVILAASSIPLHLL